MQKDKFYPYKEISKLILENSIHRQQLEINFDNSASVVFSVLHYFKPVQNMKENYCIKYHY